MATIRSWERNLNLKLRSYLDILHNNIMLEVRNLETAENFYNAQILVSKELEFLKLREEAADLVEAEDCGSAVLVLDEYFENVENPDLYAWLEYANAKLCSEDYEGAIEIYDNLLAENYSYDIAISQS
jgi:tetratricopeptide (TPR) repeat protein